MPTPSDLSASPKAGSYPWYHWRRWGLNFLTISILAHLLFGTAATYFIVQTIQAKRKQNFAGAPQGATAPMRALEHKVQLQKKQQTMSAPAPVKRITTSAANAKVALPAMPAMPRMNSAIAPLAMAGMGGTSLGLGMGTGGSAGGSGGGGGLNVFGMRNGGQGLVGTFFDLKQTPDQHPTPIGKNGADGQLTPDAGKAYQRAVLQFVNSGMDDNTMASHYYKGPNPLYTSQVFIPLMSADEGPKAFNLESQVRPSRWIAHYKGTVIAPESGTYHFVGNGDDMLVVRFNGNLVLDCGSAPLTGRQPSRYYAFAGLESMMGEGGWFKGCGEGSAFEVSAGQSYPVDIMIGEWPGGSFHTFLQIRKDGAEYQKDVHGNPVLPLFRVTGAEMPAATSAAPVYQKGSPIWRTTATSSIFSRP